MYNFRENTWDRAIFQEVNDRNTYRLPEAFHSTDVAIDIGMHIGSFANAWFTRGGGSYLGYEAQSDNFKQAAINLKQWVDEGKAHIFNKAVWEKDDETIQIGLNYIDDAVNTGGYSYLQTGAGLQKITTISLDTIMHEYERVRLVKLDCEGSEIPILNGCRDILKIQTIVGEYHTGIDDIKGIAVKLRKLGFKRLETTVPTGSIGLFFFSSIS